MLRLIILILIVLAAWYGWHHYGDVLNPKPKHDVVIENRSGKVMERVRLTIGGQGFVRESLANEENATFGFRVDDDATFELVWKWAMDDVEHRWTGGNVFKGPLVQRHHILVDADGGITYHAEPKGAATVTP
jgi:hypothetical protein